MTNGSFVPAILGFFAGLLLGGSATAKAEQISIPTYIIGLGIEQVAPPGTNPQQDMRAVSIKVERKGKLVKLQGNVQISNFNPSLPNKFIEVLFTWYLTSYKIPDVICCSYGVFMLKSSDRIAGEVVETFNNSESHNIDLYFNMDIPEGYYLTTVIDCFAQEVPIHAEAQIYAVIEDPAQMNWLIDGGAGMKGHVEAKPYMYWYITSPINKIIAYGLPTDVPATYVDGHGNDQIAIIRYEENNVYLDEDYLGVAKVIKNLSEVIITDNPGYTSRIQIL